MSTFNFMHTNGFGQTIETIRAEDVDHGARIMAERLFGKSISIRRNHVGTAWTAFGKDGHELGRFSRLV